VPEWAENALLIAHWNARPAVFYLKCEAPVQFLTRPEPHPGVTCPGGVLKRIVQQIRQNLPDKREIGVDQGVRRSLVVDHKAFAGKRRTRLEHLLHFAEKLRYFDRRIMQTRAAILQSRVIQNVINQIGQAIRFDT
jgi:hypothetical protein